MDSNYSVLPKDSLVELQARTSDSLKDPPSRTGNQGSIDVSDVAHDPDDLPLIFSDETPGGSGVYSAVFNLTTSVIGAGIMALPAAMKVLGLLPGTLLIVLMGILSEITVELLVKYADLCKVSSYGEIVRSALGRRAKILVEVCIIVNNAGVLVVYLIIMGDVMAGSSRHLGVFHQWLGDGIWDQRKLVIFLILVLFLSPLCALRNMDSLSFSSAASVALAVIFVLVACFIALIKLIQGKIEPPRLLPNFSSESAILDLLVVIPIMSNAFVCHFNVLPIYNELESPTAQKMNGVGRLTTFICVSVYAATATSGYLLFGEFTEADVLTNFDTNLGIPFSNALNYIVRVGYILHLILVFPVIHFSLRQAVDEVFFEGSATPLAESRGRCWGLTVVLLFLTFLGSTTIPNIWTAFKFTGATTAVSLGFAFPALISLRLGHLGKSSSSSERNFSWVMLILALLVTIVGLIGNVLSISNQKT